LKETEMVVEQKIREDEDDEALMRSLTRCEEDRRRLYPGVAWNGGYRWFRSPNIIPLERFRPSLRRGNAPPRR
jgi:hypothetical protein